ncbi:MAG: hypothetical protein WCD79_10515 [Chthoniobacteraceae bacterium]
MLLRIFIVVVTAMLIALEAIFLPCEFVNKGMAIQPDAGYHTFSNINTEMVMDGNAVIYEMGITLLLGAVALTVAEATARDRRKSNTPKWRIANP